jgi:hypothetical protein
MRHLWACIEPRGVETRLLITNEGKEPLLKARMNRQPQHRRALPMLLEAIAQWEGRPIRAALVADDKGQYDSTLYHDCLVDDCETPLYSIEVVPPLADLRRLHRDEIDGMGRFHDLKQLMLFEVAR